MVGIRTTEGGIQIGGEWRKEVCLRVLKIEVGPGQRTGRYLIDLICP